MTAGSSWRKTSFTHGWPQTTAASRVMIRACARWVIGTSAAVRSPLPMSSVNAACTDPVMWAMSSADIVVNMVAREMTVREKAGA